MNLPNVLSLVRIFLVPVLVVFLIVVPRPYNLTAAVVFLAAVLTDWLDGRIARSTRQVTTLGKLLDPMADKLLISASLISLVQVGRVPAWMVVLIVAREVAVTGLRGIASIEGLVIAASSWGKAKTILQTLALVGLLLHYEYFRIDFHLLGMILIWIALAITLWSGFDYFYKFYQAHTGKVRDYADGKMRD